MKTIRHLTWPTAVACAVLSAVNDRRQPAEDRGRYSPLETKDGLFSRSQIEIRCVNCVEWIGSLELRPNTVVF
jgi:hypothetical protein